MARERLFKSMPGDADLIQKLSEPQREILTATGTYLEIAASLSIAVGTVRSRLNRARIALMALREPIHE